MASTAFPRTMARLRQVDPPNPDRQLDADDWVDVARFRGTPPSTAAWSIGCSVDADVHPGTTGELRFRSTNSNGDVYTTTSFTLDAFKVAVTLGWVLVQPDSTPVYDHYAVLQFRRTAGTGFGIVTRADAEFVSAPQEGAGPHEPPP